MNLWKSASPYPHGIRPGTQQRQCGHRQAPRSAETTRHGARGPSEAAKLSQKKELEEKSQRFLQQESGFNIYCMQKGWLRMVFI